MTTEISRNCKLMTRIIYSRGTNFEMKYNQIRHKYFPKLSDSDLRTIQYFLEDETKEIEVFEKEGVIFWKLTKEGIENTFNDGVNLAKMTREDIENIVRLADEEERGKISVNKNFILRDLNEHPKSLRLEKLIEWSKENREFYVKNSHPVIRAEKGVDFIIRNLMFNRHNNSEPFIYSSLSYLVRRESYSDKELLQKYVEVEFSKWYFQVAYDELIEEIIQEQEKNIGLAKREVVRPHHFEQAPPAATTTEPKEKNAKTIQKEKNYVEYTKKYIDLCKSVRPSYNRERAIQATLKEFNISEVTLNRAFDANEEMLTKYGHEKKIFKNYSRVKWS